MRRCCCCGERTALRPTAVDNAGYNVLVDEVNVTNQASDTDGRTGYRCMSSHRRANARAVSGSESGHIQRHLCRNCAYRNLPNVVALGTNGLCHSIGTSCSTLAYRPVFPNVRHLTPCGGGMVFWGHRVKPTAHRRQWRPWFRRRRPCFPGLLVSGVAWRLKM